MMMHEDMDDKDANIQDMDAYDLVDIMIDDEYDENEDEGFYDDDIMKVTNYEGWVVDDSEDDNEGISDEDDRGWDEDNDCDRCVGLFLCVQAAAGVYSMVTDPQKTHHKDKDGSSASHQQQHRPPLVGTANCRTQKSQLLNKI